MRIGVDLGGTKIEIIALGDGGEEVVRKRVPTPQGDYEGTISAVASLVTDVERETGRTGTVGVGIPGALSPATGLVKNANSTCLIDRLLDGALADALGRPVRLANDANCFALSEATDGAAAGCGVVFGVILGTGVGGGLVVHGRVVEGRNAIAGEWGHNPLPWPEDDERPGPECYCGRRGCIETFLSGPGLERAFRVATGRGAAAAEIAGAATARSGAAAARSGAAKADADADAVLSRYEHRLARALATIINVLDPDAIVLGGGVSNIERIYRRVPTLWDEFVFSDRVETRLLPARHGDSSGVRGAAWLWPARQAGEPA